MAQKTSAKRTPQKAKKSGGLSAGEKAAMRDTMAERKALASGASGEALVLAAINKMKEPDRGVAKRIHEIVKETAPTLAPRTWYGMPAYAKSDKDKVILFFKEAAKFKERYATLGFNDAAKLDEGEMWATSYALTQLTPATEAKIAALVKKATR